MQEAPHGVFIPPPVLGGLAGDCAWSPRHGLALALDRHPGLRKLAELDDATFRGWIMLLACAKRHELDGMLPRLKDLAYWCRRPESVVKTWLLVLVEHDLIDRNGDVFIIHDWEHWQPRKPGPKASGTAANNMERQRAWRQRQKAERNGRNAPLHSPENNIIEESRLQTPLRNDDTIVTNSVTPPPAAAPSFSPPPMNAESDKICNLAAEIGGDVSWSLWASRRIQMGDSPAVLEAALRTSVDAGKLNQSYVGRIAARYAAEGIPVQANGNGRPSSVTAPVTVVTPEIEAQRAAVGADSKRMLAEYRERMKNGH